MVSESAASTRFVAFVCGSLDAETFHLRFKLVDTKSTNGTTLLHFLERVVSQQFTEMQQFLTELAKPAEAYRGEQAPIGAE